MIYEVYPYDTKLDQFQSYHPFQVNAITIGIESDLSISGEEDLVWASRLAGSRGYNPRCHWSKQTFLKVNEGVERLFFFVATQESSC